MKYKLADLMPKRYPENRPSAKGDYWIIGNGPCGTTKAIWNMFNPDWIERVSWFINIPGAPEEVRPRKYPDEVPFRSARKYIAHKKYSDKWVILGWGLWATEGEEAVDYFINYPLEKEMEEMEEKHRFVLWKDDDIDPCVWLGFYPDTNVYGIYSDLSETEIALDNSDLIEMCKEILEREGYDITKRPLEIAPCPNPECDATKIHGENPYIEEDKSHCFRVACNCGYRGPRHLTKDGAILGHNAIAKG